LFSENKGYTLITLSFTLHLGKGVLMKTEGVLTKKIIVKRTKDLAIVVTDNKIFSLNPKKLKIILFGQKLPTLDEKTTLEIEFNKKYPVIIDKERGEVIIPLPTAYGNSIIKH